MLALLRTRMSRPDAAFSARISVSRSDATLVFCHSALHGAREDNFLHGVEPDRQVTIARRARRVLRHRWPVPEEALVVGPAHHGRAHAAPDALRVRHHLLVAGVLGDSGHVVAGASRVAVQRQGDPADVLALLPGYGAVRHDRHSFSTSIFTSTGREVPSSPPRYLHTPRIALSSSGRMTPAQVDTAPNVGGRLSRPCRARSRSAYLDEYLATGHMGSLIQTSDCKIEPCSRLNRIC